jgi:hypothetical protein
MTYDCQDCRKRFRTESALRMHNRALHKNRPVKSARPWLSYLKLKGRKAHPAFVTLIIALGLIGAGFAIADYNVPKEKPAAQAKRK